MLSRVPDIALTAGTNNQGGVHERSTFGDDVQLLRFSVRPVCDRFFGLGVGYFVWGGHAFFHYPAPDTPEGVRDLERSLGLRGIWMP